MTRSHAANSLFPTLISLLLSTLSAWAEPSCTFDHVRGSNCSLSLLNIATLRVQVGSSKICAVRREELLGEQDVGVASPHWSTRSMEGRRSWCVPGDSISP